MDIMLFWYATKSANKSIKGIYMVSALVGCISRFPVRRPLAPTYHDFHITVNPNVRPKQISIVSDDTTVTEGSQ